MKKHFRVQKQYLRSQAKRVLLPEEHQGDDRTLRTHCYLFKTQPAVCSPWRAKVPSATHDFTQTLERTHLAVHRAQPDALELAEQDVIMTEAFQNRPSELQKKKGGKKKIKTPPQTPFPGYQQSLTCLAEELKKTCALPALLLHVSLQLAPQPPIRYSTTSTEGINVVQSPDLTQIFSAKPYSPYRFFFGSFRLFVG